jgi:hypothetical protein
MQPSQKITEILLWIILAVSAGYAYHFYSSRIVPCAAPIRYRIGTVDPRFGVSQDAFKEDIVEASGIWGSSIGRTLFQYDPKGSLVVNLVYDTRQQATQEESRLNANSAETSKEAFAVRQQYGSLESQYQAAHQQYLDLADQLTQAQQAYNAKVEYWNAHGGAPRSEYSALTAEKSSLVSRQSALQAKGQQVTQLADEINALISKYNLLIAHVNSNVRTINNDGLAGTQFEEGVFVSDKSGEKIDIYQFDSRTQFIRVLAHELGHAVGLEHNNAEDSIMNPVNQGKNLVPSPQDLQDLKAVCGM